MKRIRVVYLAVMSVLSLIAVGFGILCIRYNRLPEGLVIIGAVLSLVTIMFGVVLSENQADRVSIARMAGNVLQEADCSGTVKKEDSDVSFQGHVVFGEKGFLIDSPDVTMELIAYDTIDGFRQDESAVSVDTPDVSYVFSYANGLKARAVTNLLSKKACVTG